MTNLYLFNDVQEVIRIIPQEKLLELTQTEELQDSGLPIDRLTASFLAKNYVECDYMAVKDPYDKNAFHMYYVNQPKIEDDIVNLEGIQLGYYELKYAVNRDMRPTNQNAKYMYQQVLDGTGWRVGYVDESSQLTTNFYYQSTLSSIEQIANLFNQEVVFKVEISGNAITDKWLESYDRRGKVSKKRFTHGSNALSVVRSIDRSEIYTALIGRGRGEELENDAYGRRIDFADIEWKKSAGKPVDKPKGQDFVELPDKTANLGVYANGVKKAKLGVVIFEDIEEPEKLLQATYDELLNCARQLVQYKSTVADLGNAELGETVTIHRYDLGFHYETRIFKIERNYLNLKLSQIALGDVLVESRATRRKTVNKQIGELSDKQEQTRVDVTRAIASADGKNTIYFGNEEPAQKRVGDQWRRDDPQHPGYSQVLIWNGEAWELLISEWNTHEIETAIADNEQAAQTAQETADKGVADAEQARADAGLAGQTADQALSVATDAIGQLPKIKSDVSGLQTSLTNEVLPNLKTTVDGQQVYLKTVVDDDHASLKTTMAKVDGNASQIGTLNSNYSGLSAQFGSFETEFDNLEIGGRNYASFKDLPRYEMQPDYSITETFKSGEGTRFFARKLEAGEYTISFMFNTLPIDETSIVARVGDSGDSNSIREDLSIFGFQKFNAKQLYTRKLTLTEPKYLFYNVYGNQNKENWNVFFKVEKGSKSTDWSPAPEDLTTVKQFSELSLDVEHFKTSFQDYRTSNESKWTTYSQSAIGWNADIAKLKTDVGNKASTVSLNQVKETADQSWQQISKVNFDSNGEVNIQKYNTRLSTVEGNVSTVQSILPDKADKLTVTEMAKQFNVKVESLPLQGQNLIPFSDASVDGVLTKWEGSQISLGKHVFYKKNTANLFMLVNTSTSKEIFSSTQWFDVEPDTTYTLSFLGSAGSNVQSMDVHYLSKDAGAGGPAQRARAIISNIRLTPSRAELYSVTFKTFPSDGQARLRWDNNASTDGNTAVMAWVEPMLVKGDRVMPYAPRIGDYANDITTSAQLSVLSDQINLRVQKNDIVNQINLSTEGLLIDAGKVQITGDTYIENSVIKTAMIGDGQISSAKIADASITNAKIVNVDVSKLTAGTINANLIKMRASASGKSIEMDGNGISGWDANGKLRMKWGIQDLAGDGQSSPANLLFYTGNGTKSVSAGTNVDDLFVLGTESSTVDGLLRFPRKLTLQSTDLYLTPQNLTNKPWHIRASQDGSDQPMMYADTPNTGILGHSSYYLKDVFTYNGYIRKLNVGFGSGAPQEGDLTVSSDGDGAYVRSMAVYNRTYSYASNLFVTSYGTIGRTTSASKYKLDITELSQEELNTNILEIRPKKWYDKKSIESYSDSLSTGKASLDDDYMPIQRYYGLIAEDLIEAGLGFLCEYGKDGEVEGIQYDRIAPMLIPIIKGLKQEIEELKQRVA